MKLYNGQQQNGMNFVGHHNIEKIISKKLYPVIDSCEISTSFDEPHVGPESQGFLRVRGETLNECNDYGEGEKLARSSLHRECFPSLYINDRVDAGHSAEIYLDFDTESNSSLAEYKNCDSDYNENGDTFHCHETRRGRKYSQMPPQNGYTECNYQDRKLRAIPSLTGKRGKEKDRILAQLLQREEDRARLRQRANAYSEHFGMMTTTFGRAVMAVERIVRLVELMKIGVESNDLKQLGLECVAKNDMVYFAERFLAKHEEFRANGIPCVVDIGYHYTNKTSMNCIQKHGLMTEQDRTSSNIQVAKTGAIFGDGIYTGNNPMSFQKYGSVGLIVARLKGKTVRVPQSLQSFQGGEVGNTIIGNKKAKSRSRWPKSDHLHEVVLQSSSQCLPLLRYNREALLAAPQNPNSTNRGEAYVLLFADSLNMALDELFFDYAAVGFNTTLFLPPSAATITSSATKVPPPAPAAIADPDTKLMPIPSTPSKGPKSSLAETPVAPFLSKFGRLGSRYPRHPPQSLSPSGHPFIRFGQWNTC